MHKQEASVLFKALSEPSRVKIVKVLYHNKEFCVNELLNKVDFPTLGRPTNATVGNDIVSPPIQMYYIILLSTLKVDVLIINFKFIKVKIFKFKNRRDILNVGEWLYEKARKKYRMV